MENKLILDIVDEVYSNDLSYYHFIHLERFGLNQRRKCNTYSLIQNYNTE